MRPYSARFRRESLVFYAPKFGTATAAFLSIIASLVATVGWFLAGNPWGIDNAYIALFTPLVIMSISHVTRRSPPESVEPVALEQKAV